MQPPEERHSSSRSQASSLVSTTRTPSPSLARHHPHPHDGVVADFDAIDEACEKWAGIVSSIAGESAALRQLSSLLRRLEDGDERTLHMLLDLQFAVTRIEQDLDEAEDELVASSQAVDELECVSEEADRHLESLQWLKKAHSLPEDEEEIVASPTALHGDGVDGTRSRHVDEALGDDGPRTLDGASGRPRSAVDPDPSRRLADRNRAPASGADPQSMPRGAATPSVQALVGTSNRSGTSNSSGTGGTIFNLAHVTEDDLKNIPRTTRGHISVDSINMALDQVRELALRKRKRTDRELRAKSQMYVFPRHLNHHKSRGRGGGGGGSDDDENNGGGGRGGPSAVPTPMELTEQELRQNCAFFRSGEATARSLMLILCAVHRLKQVRGGKNGLVYYQIPELEPSRPQAQLQAGMRNPSTDIATAAAPPSHHLVQRIQQRHHHNYQQQHVTI